MSLTTGARRPHPGDDDLLRWIDRQLDLEGSRRVRGHLAGCEECARRADALRERSVSVSGWIGGIPVRLPDPSRRALALAAVERARTRRRRSAPGAAGTLLRVAAMVLLLLGVTLGTGTGRSWLGERVERAVGADPGPLGAALLRVLGRAPDAPVLGADPVRTADAMPGGPAPQAIPTLAELRRAKAPSPEALSAVSFGPSGREVVLVFDNLQARGLATLSIRNVPEATARITLAARGEKLLPTPSGLHVRNLPGSHAEYDIVVPTRVRVIRVRIAKRQDTLISVSPSKQAWLWTINLENTALR